MWAQIASGLEPALVSAAIAVLTAIIGVVGGAIIQLLAQKKAAIIQKIGVDRYNQELAEAKAVWGIVDEFFRTNPTLTKTMATAAAKFNEILGARLPYLTSDELDHLRQAVAGEVNKGKGVLITPAAADSGTNAADGAVTGASAAADVKADTSAQPAAAQ